jgi:tetratricopeptide (TPR) repeat protein
MGLSGAASSDEVISVFEAALTFPEAAAPYRMRILAALGGLCYRAGRFTDALGYYNKVDENELGGAYIEQILNVFLQTHEWARAASLVARKRRFIPNKSLYAAVKRLSNPELSECHLNIAEAAYGLLLDRFYDGDLLSITLKHYSGGQSEWEQLRRALSAINVTAPGLDEIIVKNSI